MSVACSLSWESIQFVSGRCEFLFSMRKSVEICGHPLSVTGRLCRVVRLRDEYHDFIDDPGAFLAGAATRRQFPGNLFTLIQRLPDPTPRFAYHLEWDTAAVLPL